MSKEKGFALNTAQQKVVDHKKGPLLVVAGAGTGKTRVIVEKINALLNEGVKPESILALTFTEKAAAEMLDRALLSRSGLLLDLPIMTFNGYGESILKEFGTDIGIPRNFTLLGQQAQIVFFRERIDTFKLDYFLPLSSSPDAIIEEILKLFSRLKQRLITPEMYQDFAKKLPSSDEAEQLEKKKQSELANAYATYVYLCRKENVIDYDDQIYLVIQLLQKRPNVRNVLQKRYHTVFVDEFQDTNPMQSELIDLIIKEDGNLIVVGDDDQSIYGFRGATIANIIDFKQRYPAAKEVVLTQNYRSSQAILDSAYTLIQHNNPNRLEATLKINKQLTSTQPGSRPVLQRFSDTEQEIEWIANDIAAKKSKIKAGQPISIAVLTRSNPTALTIHQALLANGVEHKLVGSNPDLYTRPIVRTLIELLYTLVEPHNNMSLHHTLVSELFAISNELLAPLAAKAKYEHESLESLLKTAPSQKIQEALKLITELRAEAASLSIRNLLWRSLEETGYKDRILAQADEQEDMAILVGHLHQFFESLKEFERIAVQPTAAQYLVSLPALKAAGESVDDTIDISQDQIVVTTIHKAKGLEWDTVYIPFLTEQTFPLYRQSNGLTPPEALLAATESPADDHYAEERRIMYVAATRARRNVLFSYSDKGKTGTSRRPSRFINELFGTDAAQTTKVNALAEIDAKLDHPVEQAEKVAVPKNIYTGKAVRLSVSQAQQLLDCPRNFYYKFVLKAPEKPSSSTDYGTQLHGFFEEINKGRKEGNLRPLEAMLTDLKNGWNKGGYSSKAQQERAFIQAEATLSRFYQHSLKEAPPYQIEYKFEVPIAEDIILHGRIDAVFKNGGLDIRDYKTGDSVKDEKKAISKARESKQLTLYALAWQIEHGEMPTTVTLQYPDTDLVASVRRKQQTLDSTQEKLIKAVSDLKIGKFPLGTSRHDYCLHPSA